MTSSSALLPTSFASSSIVGSRPFFFSSCSRALYAFEADSFSARLTRIIPSSRKNRRISPAISGTAYVEKRTSKLQSNRSIAFISPMLPICTRSSRSHPRPRKRCATVYTSPIFSFTSSSLAALSPSCTCLISARVRSICQPAATPFCRFLLF